MGYYVVHALDRTNMAEARAANRSEHRKRLREHEYPLTVQIGGPMLDRDGYMCGTMLVIEAENQPVVEAYLADDPYAKAGVYASVTIHPYLWGLGQPEEHDG